MYRGHCPSLASAVFLRASSWACVRVGHHERKGREGGREGGDVPWTLSLVGQGGVSPCLELGVCVGVGHHRGFLRDVHLQENEGKVSTDQVRLDDRVCWRRPPWGYPHRRTPTKKARMRRGR